MKYFWLLPLPLLVLLLPDATWQTVLIVAGPWIGAVFGLCYSKYLRLALALAALLGLGYAAYLQTGEAALQCATEGCAIAQSSWYASMFFGIRTSLVGVIGYTLVLLSLLLPERAGQVATLALATIGFGVSMFLSFSSVLVLHTTCQWCLGSASAMTALFVLSLRRSWLAMR